MPTTCALVLCTPKEGSKFKYDTEIQEQNLAALKEGEVLVKMGAVAFNHRELWIRKGMYPRIAKGSTIGADGAGSFVDIQELATDAFTGKVVASFDQSDSLLGKRVFLTPMRGWESHPHVPEKPFGILGGAEYPRLGTFSEYVVVDRNEVILTPDHLSDREMAAWPLAGLTAWRSISLANVPTNGSVLITGIGGGVALLALQLCVAMGFNVYVTSGSQSKIDKAIASGAMGGVKYSDKTWPKQLAALLKSHGLRYVDSVIDSGGSEIMQQVGPVLAFGGKVVCYGMTAGPTISLSMREVMRNQQLIEGRRSSDEIVNPGHHVWAEITNDHGPGTIPTRAETLSIDVYAERTALSFSRTPALLVLAMEIQSSTSGSKIPRTTRALMMRAPTVAQQSLYNDALLEQVALPTLKPGQVLVKITAAAYNHRDLWLRKGLYPKWKVGRVLGSDGAGVVIAAGDAEDPLLNKRVFLTPMRGWESHPHVPEETFGVLGGTAYPDVGTFQEHIVLDRKEVIPTPSHLTDEEIAAWPLAGLTAWRSISLAEIPPNGTVFITGIGGGVALTALQLCVGMGLKVYVSSGGQGKIDKAIAMGAKGGVRYSDENWPQTLAALLKSHKTELDAVIDSGGDEILAKTAKSLKFGGKVVCYGMTAGPKITMSMPQVMRNQQLIGTLLGSRKDLISATEFVEKHKIVPIVGKVLTGLESAEEGFEIMEKGTQFGKIVIKVGWPEGAKATL
ncbi:unnamed protein product [Mycena citricolor]|uniref:Enoyl reductase (ER) domain-containing protein n=1 Tax=Mycena citricolor TaxID=2018698 RepID=A0AAD2K419_9AGAR|nr:unnamed protein product [Mycena citricolor]CAK5277783.1 unnamed protein product [Mycena citricolor]CAK5277794.1 unnamed protein product [Mycena citricolor]